MMDNRKEALPVPIIVFGAGFDLRYFSFSEDDMQTKEQYLLAPCRTASGQCNNASTPEKLYRRCGFTGNDVWHIFRKDPVSKSEN